MRHLNLNVIDLRAVGRFSALGFNTTLGSWHAEIGQKRPSQIVKPNETKIR